MMKRTFSLALLLVLCAAPSADAQVHGRALYDLMDRERLTVPSGTFRVTWLPQGQGYLEADTEDGATRFFRVDPASGERAPLFDEAAVEALRTGYARLTGETPEGLPFDTFDYVDDGDGLTFETGGRYFLFDLAANALRELKRPKVEPQPGTDGLMRNMRGSQLWNGTYSPDFSRFAYVKGYDLFVVDTQTGQEKQVTFGGNENVFNGRPDWVYPEEFRQLTAYWWSPDNRRLAYYQYDETDVHPYPIVHALSPEAALEAQKYPKPGETNPTVHLFIVDVETGERVQVDTDSDSDTYIIRPMWWPDGSVLTFQRLNRRQNHLELLAADPATGAVRTILEEQEDAFINLHDDFIPLAGGDRFLWSSERTGWRHLYLYDRDGTLLRTLTSGAWPVGGVSGVDEAGGWVYFTGYTNDGLESHLFRVRLDGTGLAQLTTEPGSHYVGLDPAARYYTDYHSSFDTPPTATLHRADGALVRTIGTTDASKLDALGLEPPELVVVKAADGVTDLHGLLYKPAGYDPAKAYPLVVSVYGGPHSKSVSNQYVMNGSLQQLAQLGFMVWVQDNRGLTRRGKAFETETYLKLGQVDLADQAAGVRQIAERPYVDGSRVGVFGHSYGGYMTAMALVKEPDVFHVGVAGAPVTDWRNYDTIYTERYMRTPQENTEGYDVGSAMPYAGNLKGKLLLVHGTIDNNVHPGNTTQLVHALVEAGKRFDLMLYPDNRHGIRGAAGQHYRDLRLDYLLEHLKPETAVEIVGESGD